MYYVLKHFARKMKEENSNFSPVLKILLRSVFDMAVTIKILFKPRGIGTKNIY